MTRVRKLFFGHTESIHRLRPAIRNQVYTVLRIWRNYSHDDVGIERIIRLSLASLQFLTIGLYIKQFAGRWGLQVRKMAIEAYVLVKLAFPICIFLMDLEGHPAMALMVVYFLSETVLYVAGMVFLADVSREILSPRRSLTLLFFNFFEIIFDFAVLYAHLDSANQGMFSQAITSGKDAVYFSFVTAATVGFGDIVPLSAEARALALIQITLTFIFVVLFLNFFSNMLQRVTHVDTSRRSFRKTRHQKRK